MVKGELAEKLNNTWRVGLIEAPCKAPVGCCYGCCCPCCMVYGQRNEILDITGEPYVCCGGLYADACCAKCCTFLKEPQSDRNPCLCAESCCCTTSAIMGNRFMIQTRFDRRNDAWDDCIITLLVCANCVDMACQCLAMLSGEGGEEADCCSTMVDILNSIVFGCMLGQHKDELELIKEEIKLKPYTGPPDFIMQEMPPLQQEMICTAFPAKATPQYGATPMVTGIPVQQGQYAQQPQYGAPVAQAMPVAQAVPVAQARPVQQPT